MRVLFDTSVVIAPPATDEPSDVAVSTMTLAELEYGVAFARDDEQRAARAVRLARVQRLFEALPVDREVARRYGELVARARRAGRRPRVSDALIAATAIAHGLELVTRDSDFEALPGLELRLIAG